MTEITRRRLRTARLGIGLLEAGRPDAQPQVEKPGELHRLLFDFLGRRRATT